jgi:polyhydroxyalkanoate synthesis regulator phasin
MWKKIWAIVVCVVSVSGSCVFADTPVVNARENNQEKRINQGVKSGKLTKPQARQLRREIRGDRQEKRAMIKANGGRPLSAQQRMSLRQNLNRSSRQIYQQKHAGRPPVIYHPPTTPPAANNPAAGGVAR